MSIALNGLHRIAQFKNVHCEIEKSSIQLLESPIPTTTPPTTTPTTPPTTTPTTTTTITTTTSQKASSGDISGTKHGSIDPLVSK